MQSHHEEATLEIVRPGHGRPLPPRYRDPLRIALGGMSEVYRATDAKLGRIVAIKVLDERHALDRELRRRFTREARTAARLAREPHTVTIFDVDDWQGRPFITMEYLEGGSLADVLRLRGAQQPSTALRWLCEAADALDHAHAEGVVHRDVKPANLLLDGDERLRVTDFGIAAAFGLTSLTATGTVLGTAGYLSPEQAEGKRAGPAADRYSLAVVAFELLVGERPFRRDSATAEAAAHVNAPVPSASRCRTSLPARVDPTFERALAKDPHDRFASCREFVDALEAALAPPGGTTLVAPVVVPAAGTGSRRLAAASAAALLLAVAGVATAELGGGSDGAAARTRATHPVTVTVTVAARPAPRPAASVREPAGTGPPGHRPGHRGHRHGHR